MTLLGLNKSRKDYKIITTILIDQKVTHPRSGVLLMTITIVKIRS